MMLIKVLLTVVHCLLLLQGGFSFVLLLYTCFLSYYRVDFHLFYCIYLQIIWTFLFTLLYCIILLF